MKKRAGKPFVHLNCDNNLGPVPFLLGTPLWFSLANQVRQKPGLQASCSLLSLLSWN